MMSPRSSSKQVFEYLYPARKSQLARLESITACTPHVVCLASHQSLVIPRGVLSGAIWASMPVLKQTGHIVPALQDVGR